MQQGRELRVGREAGAQQATKLRKILAAKNETLMGHRYFRACRGRELGRAHLLEIVKQLYCFSVFFERLLTRRITDYTSDRDPRVLAIAREHLREEIGHAELFKQCLATNGLSSDDVARISPKMFTKALFGYLTATLQHENEYVANVAIIQVMESIGYYFFNETLAVMQAHGMAADALYKHTEDDERHPELGFELVRTFDDRTMRNCERIIDDVYRLMAFVLDEWLGLEPGSASITKKRRSSRPPRAN
jgi:hypothetical protein